MPRRKGVPFSARQKAKTELVRNVSTGQRTRKDKRWEEEGQVVTTLGEVRGVH